MILNEVTNKIKNYVQLVSKLIAKNMNEIAFVIMYKGFKKFFLLSF